MTKQLTPPPQAPDATALVDTITSEEQIMLITEILDNTKGRPHRIIAQIISKEVGNCSAITALQARCARLEEQLEDAHMHLTNTTSALAVQHTHGPEPYVLREADKWLRKYRAARTAKEATP